MTLIILGLMWLGLAAQLVSETLALLSQSLRMQLPMATLFLAQFFRETEILKAVLGQIFALISSPLRPLVIAYALAGSMHHYFDVDPLGVDDNGKEIFLKDIWPSSKEIADLISKTITRKMFKDRYSNVYKGDKQWRNYQSWRRQYL